MPIARYFAVVGGTLLALLLALDWYFADGLSGPSTLPVEYAPALPQARDFNLDFDIRIHSDREWPERLLLDGELPQ
ncbi:MAG TPA: hypothetical protein VKY22_21635 [Bradyrhizobium sp.]|nr:hypothetical protein [Bradyrhizobium sp.]